MLASCKEKVAAAAATTASILYAAGTCAVDICTPRPHPVSAV
jgi:hypothetical protein